MKVYLKKSEKICLGFLTGLTIIIFLQSFGLAKPMVLQNNEITIFYEPTLESAAAEVLRMYPELKQELQNMLSAKLDLKPQVVLIKNSNTFWKLSRNELFVAFAIPDKNLIVIDYSRMHTHPFTLRTTFKHELCHLLLHRHISRHNLPRWFEEGICQWVSDGIGELLMDKSWSGLDAAIMSGKVLEFGQISGNFPRGKQRLMLAYEQSKSFVNYIDRQYGKKAILDILDHLKNNQSMEVAVLNSLGVSIAELEREWLLHLERTPRWLVYIANHLYGILFFTAALLTVFGYIRRILRKRQWENEEEEDD